MPQEIYNQHALMLQQTILIHNRTMIMSAHTHVA